jgi:predicted DNA-binding transcriptional regulator AlpA
MQSASAIPSRYLTNTEAADFLTLSPKTLNKLRVIGGGPRFRKLGRRVAYKLADLEEWATRRVCESTSDPSHPSIANRPGVRGNGSQTR